MFLGNNKRESQRERREYWYWNGTVTAERPDVEYVKMVIPVELEETSAGRNLETALHSLHDGQNGHGVRHKSPFFSPIF